MKPARMPARERADNPPVGLVTPETDRDAGGKRYEHDPYPDPQLFRAGKAEHTSCEVSTVSLHVHECIEPRAIVEAVRRQNGAGPAPNPSGIRVFVDRDPVFPHPLPARPARAPTTRLPKSRYMSTAMAITLAVLLGGCGGGGASPDPSLPNIPGSSMGSPPSTPTRTEGLVTVVAASRPRPFRGPVTIDPAGRPRSFRGPVTVGPTGRPRPARGPVTVDPAGRPRPVRGPVTVGPTGRPRPAVAAGRPRPAVAASRPRTAVASGRPRTAIAAGRPRTAIASGRPRPAVAASRPRTAIASGRPRPAIASGRPRPAIASGRHRPASDTTAFARPSA